MPKVKSRLPTDVSTLLDKLYDKGDKVRSRKKLPRVAMGHLALFAYPNPKTAAQMLYYDILPLVIILDWDSTYLRAINTHWIPYTYRIQFLKIIMKKLDNGNKLKYKDIKDAWEKAKIPVGYGRLAYRVYLISRIQSEFKIFGPDNYLPVAQNVLGVYKKRSASAIMKDINARLKDQRKKLKSKKP